MTSAPAPPLAPAPDPAAAQPATGTPPRRRPRPRFTPWLLDGAAVLCGVVGSGALSVTADPGWVLVQLIGCALLPLGTGARRWLVTVFGLCGVGLVLGLGGAIVATSSWQSADRLAWGRAVLAVTAVCVLTAVSRARLRRLHSELVDAKLSVDDASVHDPLTGLPNRKGLAMLSRQILESARRRGDAVYCMYLNVDGLARVNDELGRQSGDAVLTMVGQSLDRSTRATDAVARVGADEFVVIGPGTGLAPQEIERRVRTRCVEQAAVPAAVWPARVSAGGAVLEPWDDGDIDTLLDQARRELHLRRTVRREAAVAPYRPMRHDPSPRPPEPRR
ncbi:MAG: GGDEF domain-containing protein [Angustibacter sp.]